MGGERHASNLAPTDCPYTHHARFKRRVECEHSSVARETHPTQSIQLGVGQRFLSGAIARSRNDVVVGIRDAGTDGKRVVATEGLDSFLERNSPRM
jgi:hypothetical protein